MQEDKLRTLLELLEEIADERPNEELVILRLGRGKWWVDIRSITRQGLTLSPNTASHDTLDLAFKDFIKKR
jgi:hypothetical protein